MGGFIETSPDFVCSHSHKTQEFKEVVSTPAASGRVRASNHSHWSRKSQVTPGQCVLEFCVGLPSRHRESALRVSAEGYGRKVVDRVLLFRLFNTAPTPARACLSLSLSLPLSAWPPSPVLVLTTNSSTRNAISLLFLRELSQNLLGFQWLRNSRERGFQPSTLRRHSALLDFAGKTLS